MRWTAAAILVVGLAVGLTAGATDAPVSDHGPIALYQPALERPVEAAGTDLDPTVRAKLSIDAAGRVSGVEILAVEPSSALDDVFRQAATGGFATWRFAPAEKNSTAQPSEISIGIRFAHETGPRAPSTEFSSYLLETAMEASFESARYEFRARILALGQAARRQIADQIAARASSLLKPARFTAKSDWLEVVTDYGGQKQADAVLQNCAETFAVVHRLLGDRIPPLPREDPVRVFVYETRAQYEALARNISPFEGSEGIYHPAGVLAFHSEFPTVAFMISIMLHESTHAFVDRFIVRRGVSLPRWFDEGFAEYVGESDIKNHQIVLGGHESKRNIVVTGIGTIFWQSPSRARTEDAQRAQRQKRALTLADIVDAGPEKFYGKDVELYYAQGWLAVHFLRHGRPSWADTEFPRFLLYMAEGYPADAAFRTVYGAPPSTFEADYQRYVKRF